MKRLILPALAGLALAACATQPTLYQPAAAPNAVGYSDYRIENDRFRVTFQGGPGASPQYVSDLALLRAADLAIANGYDWFRVTDRFMQGRGDSGPRVGVGLGGADFGRHSSVGLGLGTSFSLGGGPSAQVTLEVMMGKGERPRDRDTYDARSLRQNLAPRV
ncbi:CC0125/CC1285 family lipoprotein [Phenylobacterium sp. VNQ135]|uniref:CC0125/CC1285 family lipoprotein n=1 Tax=Phenylobacterium sp. VNQ135 TaxID=3400922 RepID=UPI003C10FB01